MPHEIQFDAAGHLYIAERDNHVIRKVDAKTGIISTFAGTGQRRILRRRRAGAARAAAAAAQHRRRSGRPPAADLRHRQPSHPPGRSRDRRDRHLRRHRRAAADAGWRAAAGNAAERSADDRVRSGRQPVPRASRRQRHLSDRCPATNPAPRGWHRRAGIFRRRRAGPRGKARRAEGAGVVARITCSSPTPRITSSATSI